MKKNSINKRDLINIKFGTYIRELRIKSEIGQRELAKKISIAPSYLNDIEKDFLPRFREYYASEELRTCNKCGTVMETDPRFV